MSTDPVDTNPEFYRVIFEMIAYAFSSTAIVPAIAPDRTPIQTA